ncbi:hypothetical protein [Salegentibacter salarius]|uniref:Uncharacterized protein n=1 Tax=Salegentibacter salarius TaxID=435906 RepID=A0A2N0TX12_9FLAO|nr:hypothetical protein [Salegentibacter salarius]OEY72820.1 hypothetical protein BHS39_11290 [Salegentibacter salarius]PKD19280.1 hypothetical protein APR40_11270 [Salegentibacter salarius]SLJ99951.1 hypothetical protein SAMN05660445_02304 [Salegentibacter salarius]
MKINGYKFGHPVFGDHDYYDFGPQFNVEEFIQDGHLVIKSDEINFGANRKLEEMLLNGDARLIAEIYCTHTMYRKVFEQEYSYNISIPLDNLKNKVEALFLLVATKDIEGYSNPSVKEEAKHLEFYIEQGEALAYLGEYHFELDLIGTSLDSIIKIKAAEAPNTSDVNYSYIDDSITIELPRKKFEDLKMYVEDPDYQKLLISSLLQTALIHACYKLCGKDKEAYFEKQWARVLNVHWQNQEGESEYPNVDDIPPFVENILQKPTGLLLDTLAEMENRYKNNDIE